MNPLAFSKLQLEDIKETFDYFALPLEYIDEHLVNILTHKAFKAFFFEEQPNLDFQLSLYRLHMTTSARCVALNIGASLPSAPQWVLWHGGMYFALLVPTGNDVDRAPTCLHFEIPDLSNELWALDGMKALERLARMRKNSQMVRESPLEVETSWAEFGGEGNDKRRSAFPPYDFTRHSFLTPTNGASFCDALQRELARMGLNASWCRGSLKLSPVNGQNEFVHDTAQFLFVSWI